MPRALLPLHTNNSRHRFRGPQTFDCCRGKEKGARTHCFFFGLAAIFKIGLRAKYDKKKSLHIWFAYDVWHTIIENYRNCRSGVWYIVVNHTQPYCVVLWPNLTLYVRHKGRRSLKHWYIRCVCVDVFMTILCAQKSMRNASRRTINNNYIYNTALAVCYVRYAVCCWVRMCVCECEERNWV